MALSKIDVSKMITGVTPLINGGTGATSFTPGKLAQVVQAICAGGDTSTTSSTDQSSNVAVAITPSASDSKVLIHMTFGGSSGADYNKTLRWRLYLSLIHI